MARRLVRVCVGKHALLLAVPLVAAVIGAVVAIDRFILGATTALWTYWKDGLSLLVSVYTLLRLQFPQTLVALHWTDQKGIPVESPDGSCTYNFRLFTDGEEPAKIEVLVTPSLEVMRLADGQSVLPRAIRLVSLVNDRERGFHDIRIRLSSANLPDASGPLFCQGRLEMAIGVHFSRTSSRSVKTVVPVCHVVGGGVESC